MNIPVDILIPLLQETTLQRGAHARLTVSGSSMLPFMRQGDVVELAPVAAMPQNGALVLLRRDEGTYVLHRVVRVSTDRFWLLGDAQTVCEGPFTQRHIVANIVAAWRGGTAIVLRPPTWRLWYWLRPLRPALLRWGARVRRLAGVLRPHVESIYL